MTGNPVPEIATTATRTMKMNDYAHRHVCVPKSKYNASKQVVQLKDGTRHEFDSRKEADRYYTLRLMERAGQITGLKIQVPFVLIPAQKDADGNTVRDCKYIADFTYYDKAGNYVVEDVKGYRGGTAYEVFKIKKKLMNLWYGITVREV